MLTFQQAMEQAIIDFTNMKRIFYSWQGDDECTEHSKDPAAAEWLCDESIGEQVRWCNKGLFILSEEGYTEFFDAEGALTYKLKERTIPPRWAPQVNSMLNGTKTS